ncbi:protein ImpG/VasA [Klebsiella pneumoniae subsp. pneumoniae]|nr:protein ImpG/VasA [Klebsiella pneumoniae]STV41003.1 protein ImpG/VasA [Klebsiella pneumoniae subsp. pneumoniae]
MDDLTLRYFDAEMRYLREAAKAFAQAHPDRAAMLDLDKAGTPDPYVERLFEGFAFSVGRLREKIDDDLPELTEGWSACCGRTICAPFRRYRSWR